MLRIAGGLSPTSASRSRPSSAVTCALRPEALHERDLRVEALAALWKSSPSASYSSGFQPTPSPSRKRPPESMSTSAACFAASAVWRWGRMMIPVVSSIVRVHAAMKPNSTNGSWNGCEA